MQVAPSTPDELRVLVGAVPDGSVVRIRYRPGVCRTERQERFAPGQVTHDGCAGVDPDDVVKAVCRALDCGPGALAFDPDPEARHLRGDQARCYLVAEKGGERRAHIVGISFAWLTVSASRLLNRGWRPGQNPERGCAWPGPFPAVTGAAAGRGAV